MIFVDTSYIIAIIIEKDPWHDRVSEIEEKTAEETKITSDMIIAESIAIIGSLKGGKIAKTMYDYIKDNYSIYETNMNMLDTGMNTLIKYDGTLSLTDSVTIDIMKDLEIYNIISFDSDFDNKDSIVRIH